MKKPVMQRSMFVAVAPKSESKGILSGFDEEMDNENYEDRSPENLEIIANNLRGDMRSMDERYLELAQMVGESAFETPEEVVALMQSQMGQQGTPPTGQAPAPSAGGVAALGAPPMPSAPQGIMQGIAEPGMEQQMPQPGMEQPMQMAQGGMVYRQAGSPPIGEVSRTFPSTVYQSSPPVTPRTIDPELFRQATTKPPNMLNRMTSSFGDLMRSQVQTQAPVTKAGNPIPFVDKFGRFYQPVGGTNPNMPSRGFPSASALPPFSRMAGRFLGPVGFAGGFLTNELVTSDRNKGQLYPSMFGLETGETTANLVGGEPVFAPEPSSLPAFGKTGDVERDIGELLIAGKTGDPERDVGPEIKPSGPVPPPAPPAPSPGKTKEDLKPPSPKDFRERVKEKMDIYSEFLGGDPEARKAQALFLLAEAALNVAGATGRSTAERLAKGLKGLPAGMAAIGAETEKDKKSIAAAAISSVEQEYADARKAAAAVAKAAAGKGIVNDKVQSIFSSIKARNPEMDDNVALQYAIDRENGTIYEDPVTKEDYDKITGEIRHSPYRPLGPNSVGYIDPNNPFAKVSSQTLDKVVDPGQRKELLEERRKLQSNLPLYDRFLADVYGDTVGILPTIQSGASQFTLALFGDVGFGLTNVQKNAARQNSAIANEFVTRGMFRNNSRVSNLDMTRTESLVKDPNKLAQSSELVVTSIQNFARQDINRLAEIDNLLGLNPQLVQLDRIPSGAFTDPMPAIKGVEPLIREAFLKRPNLEMHIQFSDGKKERINQNHPYVRSLLQGATQ